MNNDKKRFVDVTELSKELGLSTSEAVELAVKADAVMKIGSKVWYEKDKVKEYLTNDKRPAIHWLSVASGGKFHDGETEDVIVTLQKPSSKNKKGCPFTFIHFECITQSDGGQRRNESYTRGGVVV